MAHIAPKTIYNPQYPSTTLESVLPPGTKVLRMGYCEQTVPLCSAQQQGALAGEWHVQLATT